ncbi:hypothetical protein PR202_ga28505 [Eleusine coracana subsp. coracana]|uniref:F-box domain-containing protein n=1 Tax=Eleusine coracana subsp. coracana TaxID=191504 RepID=A0AAV5DJA3_ELECO|nr:hypothetical protein PR202_ga28505 [Eleusine coracana subsp. coracana]
MAAPPELIDDATAEIFLRLSPDDPACLVRAAFVCKRWRRILSDPAFPRRYREFHRTPPLLGFLRNRFDRDPRPQFVPTADASPFSSPEFDCKQWWTLDCRHGRVLFRCVEPDGLSWWTRLAGIEGYSLLLWSRHAVADGIEDWVQHRVINLKSVLPIRGLPTIAHLAGVTEGADTIFMNTYVGIFVIELSSGQVRKVGEREQYTIVPYMSFYTPGTSLCLSLV